MASKPKYTKKYTNWDNVPLIMNVEEACCLLRISDVTLRKWLREGKIKATNPGGAQWFIPRSSIFEFLNGGM